MNDGKLPNGGSSKRASQEKTTVSFSIICIKNGFVSDVFIKIFSLTRNSDSAMVGSATSMLLTLLNDDCLRGIFDELLKVAVRDNCVACVHALALTHSVFAKIMREVAASGFAKLGIESMATRGTMVSISTCMACDKKGVMFTDTLFWTPMPSEVMVFCSNARCKMAMHATRVAALHCHGAVVIPYEFLWSGCCDELCDYTITIPRSDGSTSEGRVAAFHSYLRAVVVKGGEAYVTVVFDDLQKTVTLRRLIKENEGCAPLQRIHDSLVHNTIISEARHCYSEFDRNVLRQLN